MSGLRKLLTTGGLVLLVTYLFINVVFIKRTQMVSPTKPSTELTKMARPTQLNAELYKMASPTQPNAESNKMTSSVKPNTKLNKMVSSTKPKAESNKIASPKSPNVEKCFNNTSHHPLLFGKPRLYKGFLTIGIPSVKRPNTDKIYLFDTIDSIIANTDETDQASTVVVILVCDDNNTYNINLANTLYERYRKYVDVGFILVIHANREFYPDLEHVKQTFKDPEPRLRWRAKQNVDFAFLCYYSKNISQFYLQLEDDVISSVDFIQDIRHVVEDKRSKIQEWFLLEFSQLGYIGKLFHNEHLHWICQYLYKNNDVKPCDILLGEMRVKMGQHDPIHSRLSLFQHIGKFSSLKFKLMPSIDNRFKDAENVNLSITRVEKGNNPHARIYSNFQSHVFYSLLNAYDNNTSTELMADVPGQNSGRFTLIFDVPQNITRIVIASGDRTKKSRSLKKGLLQYSVAQTKNRIYKSLKDCTIFKKLVYFVDGEVDTLVTGNKFERNIKCLSINVISKHKTMVLIRSIEIFTF